jgi:hypothetical protein
MTFLPIVERELRVAARRRGTYGMRTIIAGVATVAFAGCFLASQMNPSVPFGKTLFWGLSALCLLYSLGAGRIMTADCLSREKREGTLGLLFLTDLKGYDVVLGKLAATSLNGFYGLLTFFPLLAIPLLSGGTTNGELCRTALALVNTFLFSLAIGLFVSALCRDEQKVMAANFGLLLLLAAVPPALDGMLMMAYMSSHRGPPTMTHEFFYSCPVYSLLQCGDEEYKKAPAHFWFSILITFNLTALLLLLACKVAPNSWQDKPVTLRSLKQKATPRWRWWREGKQEKANAFRRKLLGQNAYFWLAARPYLKASYVWTCMICMGIWWGFTTLIVGHVDDAVNFGFAFLLNGMLKLWLITEAGHQLAADKKSGAFELLLSTPLSDGDILRGQWLALRWQFLKPVIVAILFEFFLMFSAHHVKHYENVFDWWVWSAGIFMVVADLITLGWVAIAAALTEKNHDRATLKTAAFVLMLPWILFAAVEPVTYLWSILIGKAFEPGDYYYLGWWFAFGIGVDVLFLLKALRRVRASFRTLALQTPTPKSSVAWLDKWLKRSPERKIPLRARLRRVAIAGVILLTIGASVRTGVRRAFSFKLPDPVVVSIGESNHLARVSSGQGGFLFILPDGSLWSWVHSVGTGFGITHPQQVGTNRNWVQASMMRLNAAALRSDGTLWAWDALEQEPSQVDTNLDWVEACAYWDKVIARKKDGTLWERKAAADGTYRLLKQVGTNSDWKAISASASQACVLALRNDGTIWTWGDFTFLTNNVWSQTNNPLPIQLCQESNWVAFADAGRSAAHNQAGEWWNFWPFRGLPGADVPVASMGLLVSSNYATHAIGPCFSNNWNWCEYEIKPERTLWVSPFNWQMNAAEAQFTRFDQRSDWISITGGSQTLIGMTSDGTLWTWGLDFAQKRHYDLGERIGLVAAAITNSFAPKRLRQYDEWAGYQPQKDPRPLMRVVITN